MTVCIWISGNPNYFCVCALFIINKQEAFNVIFQLANQTRKVVSDLIHFTSKIFNLISSNFRFILFRVYVILFELYEFIYQFFLLKFESNTFFPDFENFSSCILIFVIIQLGSFKIFKNFKKFNWVLQFFFLKFSKKFN